MAGDVQPHADAAASVTCAVITVSDSRTPETDHSGQVIQSRLAAAGHRLGNYQIVPDDPNQIQALLAPLAARSDLAAIILNGGTGIAPRDTTYDAIAPLLEKELPGFGEIFRYLSYQDIGSRAIASRAIAGTYRNTLIFSLPGSSKAVQLAMDALILPELSHLAGLLNPA